MGKEGGKVGRQPLTCLLNPTVLNERVSDDPVDDLDVNMLFSAYFWIPLFKRQDYEENLRFVKNHLWNSVGQLIHETRKTDLRTKNHFCKHCRLKDATWMSASLLCEKAYRITNAKTNVFSNSVLCVWENGR